MKNPKDEIRDLRRVLARLPDYLQNNWCDLGDGRAYFGDGSSGENGIRTNTSAVFALAVLLKNADACELSSDSLDLWRERFSALVRYLVQSHVNGNETCADGGQWGLNWQSSWWATKLALGVDLASDVLDASEREAAERLIAREADRHLQRLIPTGLMQDTKAEETAWDAEALASAISLIPASDMADRWRKRLTEFSINTFSRPSDRQSRQVLDGIIVSDALRSCNIHEDGSLENHGAAHFCYVASPLLSKTFCDYALRRKGMEVPEALSWNVKQVWCFAEATFLKNRFAYIGGQDWARYTYGEYFILPALLYLNSMSCGDKTEEIFRRRLSLLSAESDANDDGSFFGSRFTKGRYSGQFAKYETDCFACVALALDMLDSGLAELGETQSDTEQDALHLSHESLTCYARQNGGFFSFSWRTLQSDVPNAIFLPLADDSLAEWQEGNLIGSIWIPGAPLHWVGVKAMEQTATGLRVVGEHVLRAPAGGAVASHYLHLELADSVLSVSSRFVAARRIRAVHATGINWSIPNDLFNGHARRYFSSNSDGTVVDFTSHADEALQLPASRGLVGRIRRKLRLDGQKKSFGASRWINIDDQIGIIHKGTDSFELTRFRRKVAPWSSLRIELVTSSTNGWRFNVTAGSVLLDSHFTVHLGPHQATRELAELEPE